MSLPFPLSMSLEAAINAVLRLDPDTREQLSSIDGKSIRINVTNPDVSVLLVVDGSTVRVVQHNDEPADTTISGSVAALRSMMAGNEALYTGEVRIDGDASVGQALKLILAGLDPDWQDAVSTVLGDSLTHRLDRAGQQFRKWLARTGESTRLNTADYLQEEIELLAPDSEVRRYCSDVDDLRAEADRLEARLRLLEQRATSDSSGPKAC